jgi:hypothetical protein
MDCKLFDELERTFKTEGPGPALERLAARLREQKDYGSLFYAMLMQKRHQLGVSPIPTGPASELPAEVHSPYEETIRSAGQAVGNLYLQDGNIPQAWAYFRMLNEPDPVRVALDKLQPGEEEDLQPLVQIAFYEGVHPRKGFNWILTRYGLCNAITTLSSQEMPHPPEDKQYCLQQLVRALYEELRVRLAAEVERREGKPPPEASASAGTPGVIRKLMQGRDWLFEDDFYHIDVSHLSSVVQMSVHLTKCPEMDLARELCGYGMRLSGRFVQAGDPPFENVYKGHDMYLAVLSGEGVEEGLAYFYGEAERASPEQVGTYPAEVLVNLLLRLDRAREALAVARKYLAAGDGRRLTCPSITELCQRVNDYQTLAEVAREQNDPVHFMAGLLGTRR